MKSGAEPLHFKSQANVRPQTRPRFRVRQRIVAFRSVADFEFVGLLLIVAMLFGTVHAASAAEESLGTKIKKILEPTPTPTPTRKHRKRPTKKPTPSPSPTASPKEKKVSPTPSPTATPKAKSKRKKASPTPTPSPSASVTPAESPSPSPTESPKPSVTPSVTAHATPEKRGAPNVTLLPDEIAEYADYPPKVRQIIDAGLELTK